MNIVIDMNLSPLWVQTFTDYGYSAVHWSTVGAPNALDTEIMQWARTHNHLVFTHDLDFGTLLAVTNVYKPSVLQVRTRDVTPEYLGTIVCTTIAQHSTLIEQGVLITIDSERARVRLLPLK